MSLLQERLLELMDQKAHWAYPALTRPGLRRDQLLVHFRHEYRVYIRDFPVLLARALGVTPALEDVRGALAENIYEEQTGRLSGTASHPELFVRMMAGLGFGPRHFDEDDALPLTAAALAYRQFLLERSAAAPWQAAVALLTIFVEGSVHERAEIAGTFVRKTSEEAVRAHPLVVHYGCPPEAMELTRAHSKVEGGHRRDAWRVILDHTPDASAAAGAVVATCREGLTLWLAYRDSVAAEMGLSRA